MLTCFQFNFVSKKCLNVTENYLNTSYSILMKLFKLFAKAYIKKQKVGFKVKFKS